MKPLPDLDFDITVRKVSTWGGLRLRYQIVASKFDSTTFHVLEESPWKEGLVEVAERYIENRNAARALLGMPAFRWLATNAAATSFTNKTISIP